VDRDAEIAGLRERVGALRYSAELPEVELRPTLDAVLAELDLTIGMLGRLRSALEPGEVDRAEGAEAERRLLRAVFQEVPAPIFLLERDGLVRRVNRQAAALLGIDPGSTSGRPFTSLIHLPDRAVVKKQLTAVTRTRRPRSVRCKLLGATGLVEISLTIDLVDRPGDAGPLVMAVVGPAATALSHPVVGKTSAAARTLTSRRAIAEATQRFDLMSAATRLLLENATFSESVMLRRCASLLASELSAWVFVDVEQEEELRRIFVTGPVGEQFADLAGAIEGRDPEPGSLPFEVYHSGRSRLLAGVPDPDALGTALSGVPVLRLLGATTVLCAPLTGGERRYGTVTLARRPDVGVFTAADLELAEEIAQHIAIAIKVGRMFMRRSAVTEALQASLLPRELPRIPGVELAAAYLPSTEDPDVGGDFYDLYQSQCGWGLTIGDVRGRGEEAAAVTAMARHAIRVFAHWNPDPADVLRMVNEVMQSQPGSEQFVTAIAAKLGWHEGLLRVVLASAGHPVPLLVRPDGRVRKLSGGGLPLGVFDDAHPAAEQVDLEPGDLLFFYSDGITEARSAEGGYFEVRLADELVGLSGRPAGDVVSGIRDCVLEFSQNCLRDDITMMVLRATEPPDEMPASGVPHDS